MNISAGVSGGASGTKKKRGGGGRVPTAPPPPKSGHYSVPAGTSSSSSSSSSGHAGSAGGSGSGGSGGSGGSSMSSAEARAVARENASKHKAADRYRRQAQNLEAQARALKHALNKDFKHALHIKLANVGRVLHDQQAIVYEGYAERLGSLKTAAHDNEKSEAQQSNINTSNMIRERTTAVSEALAQGAGESDQLRSQMMSLRNWQANQSEVQRSFFDTLTSVNSSLHDLNVDTKTALINNEVQSNADREQLWTNYFNQRSEAYTNLGNVRGQQADYYAMATEMDDSGGGKTKQAEKAAAGAFMGGAKASGHAWRNPGVSHKVENWEGHGDFHAEPIGASKLAAAQTAELGDPAKKPEGATLRKWES